MSVQKAEDFKVQGNELYKARQFDEAIAMYEKAWNEKQDVSILTNIAAALFEKGEHENALAKCREVIEKRYELKADYHKVAKAYVRMGSIYTKLKDYGKAMEMYEKALLEDSDRKIRALLKEVSLLKEKADAESYLDPSVAETHREKGNELFKLGDFPGAKKEYDEAIRRNPKDVRLYSNRAAALTKLLEYPSALADCEKGLSIDPKFVKLLSRKGTIHYFMKEYSRAMAAYQKGLDIEPANKECRDGLDNVLAKIQETSTSDKVDPEQLQHALADPEIQELFADPQFKLILDRVSKDPVELAKAMKDEKVGAGIRKLMAAGIIRIGKA